LSYDLRIALIQCGLGQGHVAVSGQENNGQTGLALAQLLEHFQAGQSIHTYVEQDAALRFGAQGMQKSLAAVPEFGVDLTGGEQPGQGIADGRVVVHDVDQRSALSHVRSRVGKTGKWHRGEPRFQTRVCHGATPRWSGKYSSQYPGLGLWWW